MANKRSQSAFDRKHRLDQGCCPIHGIWMGQVDGWHHPEVGKPYTIVGCPRRDCGIRAKAFSCDGPWELLLDWKYLLVGEIESATLEEGIILTEKLFLGAIDKLADTLYRRARNAPNVYRDKLHEYADRLKTIKSINVEEILEYLESKSEGKS